MIKQFMQTLEERYGKRKKSPNEEHSFSELSALLRFQFLLSRKLVLVIQSKFQLISLVQSITVA